MSTQDEFQNVCANIRYLRAHHGLSRTAMARRLGVAVRTLEALEAEVWPKRVSIRLFFKIQKAFGIQPKVLLSTRLEHEGDAVC